MLYGYLGRLGAGKTYAMVRDTLPYVGKMPIFANMQGLDWATYFDTWDDLCGLTNALVLIDELGMWAMARDYKSFPKSVLQHVINSRKQGLHIRWTAQNEAGVDVTFRRQTAIYYRHERYGNWIKQTQEDATSGKRELTRWFPLQKKIYDRYDTYQIVGDGHGNSTARGAAAVEREKRLAEEMLRHSFVRCDLPARMAFRRATPDDLWQGREVWQIDPEGGMKLLDTSYFHAGRGQDIRAAEEALAARAHNATEERSTRASYRPRYARGGAS